MPYDEPEYASLTPSAVQLSWKVPTEFPACPEVVSQGALEEYATLLKFSGVFARNRYCESLVVCHSLANDGLTVLTRFSEKSVKNWAVAQVSVRGDFFCHRSEFTFYQLQGALKHFCKLTGQSYDDPIDEYC